jgi:hypothetical protein
MLRPRTLGLVAVGLMLGVAPMADAQPTARPEARDKSAPNSWWSRWFGWGSRSTPTARASAVNTLEAKPASDPTRPKPFVDAASIRAAEEANLLRRMAVCDKLRELAIATGDAELERQADELDRQAEQLYKQRTSHLPTGKLTAAEALLQSADDSVGELTKPLGQSAVGPSAVGPSTTSRPSHAANTRGNR